MSIHFIKFMQLLTYLKILSRLPSDNRSSSLASIFYWYLYLIRHPLNTSYSYVYKYILHANIDHETLK